MEAVCYVVVALSGITATISFAAILFGLFEGWDDERWVNLFWFMFLWGVLSFISSGWALNLDFQRDNIIDKIGREAYDSLIVAPQDDK